MGGIETKAPNRARKCARGSSCATTAPQGLAEYAAPAAGLRGGLLRRAGPADRRGYGLSLRGLHGGDLEYEESEGGDYAIQDKPTGVVLLQASHGSIYDEDVPA